MCNLIRMCAWCKKIEEEGIWKYIPNDFLDTTKNITHTICEDCKKELDKELEEIKRS